MNFNTRLSVILENQDSIEQSDDIQKIRDTVTQIEQSKAELLRLQNELAHQVEGLNGNLAIMIRRYNPHLRVMLNDGCCNVSYKKKNLSFKPDVGTNCWAIDSSDPMFSKRFSSLNRESCNLASDVTAIAQAISNFFTNQYRTLQ